MKKLHAPPFLSWRRRELIALSAMAAIINTVGFAAHAEGDPASLLTEMALSIAPGESYGLLIKWSERPSITVHLLADTDPATVASIQSVANGIATECACVSSVSVLSSNEKHRAQSGEILLLIDKNGFSHFIERDNTDLEWAFGSKSKIESDYPRSAPKNAMRFKSLISGRALSGAVAAAFYDGRTSSLTSIVADGIFLGLSPSLGADGQKLRKLVEKTKTEQGVVHRPTQLGYDYLRYLYDAKVEPGMTADQVKAIRW